MRNQSTPRHILLVRNDRIGDLVLTLPAIEAVRRQFPQAHVAALVSGYAGPLLAGSQAIDELIVDDAKHSASQLASRLKPYHFDTALVVNTNTRNAMAIWRAGIQRRVMWGYKPIGWLLGNDLVRLHRSHPPLHEAEFAMAFARRLGAPGTAGAALPNLRISAAVRERMMQRVQSDLGTTGPLFGVHPGNKQSAYNWPQDYYVQLVAQLAEHGRVIVTGSEAERPLLDAMCEQLCDAVRCRVAFYTDLQLLELAAMLSLQTCLTVSSTGPMHLAAVMGTPVVALFSPHPAHVPQKWAPLGTGHRLLVAPLAPGEDPRVPRERGTELMARIHVKQALAANLEIAAGDATSMQESLSPTHTSTLPARHTNPRAA